MSGAEDAVKVTEGIGDLNSTAKGSAARFNKGKPDLSLVPLRVMARCFMKAENDSQMRTSLALACVGRFQETGDKEHLYAAMHQLGVDAWLLAAKVFEYGKGKYAPWNWTKGFQWSVPLACIGRHALKVFGGEENDDESGLSHIGHMACNIVMLLLFTRTYAAGNDLPPPELFAEAA